MSRRRGLLVAVVLALLGAVVAFGIARTSATDFVAGALSRLLGRSVEIGAIDVRLGGRLEVELSNLRVAGDDPEAPLFEAPIARFHQSWSRLLTGRVLPMAWSFERPTLRLRAGSGPGGGIPIGRVPPLELSIEDGTVLFQPREGPALRLERLRITAAQAPLRTGVRGSALGGIARGDRTAGNFAIDFDGWLEDAELRGNVEGMPLDALPWPANLPVPRSGDASGTFALALEGGAYSGALDVAVAGFRLDIPEGHRPLAPQELRLVADATWKDGRLGVTVHPLRVDDLSISGGVSIDTRPGGRVRGRLEAAPFETRPGTRLNLLRILGLRFETFADFDQRTTTGRVDELRAELDLPADEVGRSLAFERATPAEELHIHARIRDATYRARPHMTPIEELEGEIDWEGDRLRFSGVKMVRDEKPLPEIDVVIDGARVFAHLPQEERKLPETPGVPLPGLGPAFASFKPEPDAPADTVITVRDAHIAYSGFLLPFRDGEIVLRFPEGNVAVERADGVLGGALATLDALWDRKRDRIDVHVAFRDGEPPPRRDPGPFWAEGEFSIPYARFGRWPMQDVRGHVRASQALLELSDVTSRLSGGAFAARGHASLEPPDHAPFALTVELSGADASGIGDILKFAPDSLRGTAALKGTVAGKLRPDRKVLEDGEIDLRVDVKDGTIANLPLLLAVARLASPLGWTGLFGRPLPYSHLQGDLRIRAGKLHTENFALDGPELRMLAAGEIDLLPDDTPMDMVLALLFLRTVDQVLERVPLVGSFLLGENRSLVTLYFRVDGPWKDPGGMPLPPQGITSAAGWAGRVLGEGVRRIRDMLSVPGGGTPAPPPAQAPAKEERSDGAARDAQDPRT